MKNQKRIISVALTALLLAGLGGTVAAAESMKTASAAKIVSSVSVAALNEDQTDQAEKTDTKKTEKKQEAKTEEKADQEKDKKSEEADSKASAATETVKEKAASTAAASQKQTAGSGAASAGTSSNAAASTGTSSGSGSSSQGSSGYSAPSNSGSGSGNTQVSQPVQPTQPAEPAQPAQPAEPAQPSQPVHEHNWQPQYTQEKKWVVDQEAWTETVSKPVYDQRLVWYCNTCNEDITEDPEGHVDVTMHDGYRNDYVSVQVDTYTEEIFHPEEGHNEPYDVLTGYTCSCGATK